ncbi:MAG: hypothetical protein OXD46_11005 [Chloroflexi bacterium]|nr:hypothetical protein [Chloroflexota bacterium]
MKSKARFLPFVLALALLTSLFVLSPATAATGSVTLSKSHIKAPGGEVGITVNDTGANFGTVVQDEAEGQDARGVGTAIYMIGARAYTPDSVLRFRTQRAPIESASEAELYPDDDGADDVDRVISVDYRDVILRMVAPGTGVNATTTAQMMAAWEELTSPSGVTGDRHPFSLENAQGGAFILRTDGDTTVPHPISFTVTYKAPDVQEATVRVTSTQDTAGFDITAMETGADTGVFEASFTTADASDAAANEISAIAGSLITVTYEDPDGDESRDRVTVENTAPDVAVIAPDHGYATQIRGVRLSAQVTDTEAGVVEDSITFHVSATDVGTGSPEAVEVDEDGQTDIAIDGGFRSEAQLQGVPAGVTEIEWYVTVEDAAGNVGRSDRDPSTDEFENWTIRIDTLAPALESAITGQHLDDDGAAVEGASDADPTSVRVVFDEPLNGDSLATTDFRVNDIIPADVSWSGSHPESVFLTVASMASDATPAVKVVDGVADTAGNVTTSQDAVTAGDGIAPTLTVEVNPTYGAAEVEIRVRSDEALLTLPTIDITDGDGDAQQAGLSRLSLVAADHYMATYESSDTSLFNVVVSGKDTRDNGASLGNADATADDAITFEIDSNLDLPTSITLPGHYPVPGDAISGDAYGITTANPFITIEWDSEASEYTGDSHASVDVTGLTFGDFEVNTPTGDETSARSDWGDDSPVVFNVTKPTENRLLISARNLELGAYTMSFNGSDGLGNTLDDPVVITVEVKEPDPFSVTLTPGWNLVSLPAEPQMSGINDVMGDHPASIVLTYDPTQPGAWLSASRGGDGSFSGSLETISARTAYWIFTDSFDALSVAITRPTGGGVTLLPTVNLVAGWNLLPVLDVGGGAAFGDDASSVGDYVANVVRTYGYNGSSDTFSQHSGALKVGSGYWAYLSTATVLVP